MIDYIKGWQCIGCGKVDAPANCIGICQDRRVELVDARDHEAALAQAHAERDVLVALLRRLIRTTPRSDRFEAAFRAFQDEARQRLTELQATSAASPAEAPPPPPASSAPARGSVIVAR